MMAKNTTVARSISSGKFVPRAVGAAKAAKFALVEGVKLNAKSKAASALAQSRGLKGDDYRASVAGQILPQRKK